MIVLGMALTIPASILAGFAPSDEVLFVARVGGGIPAGMAYPTTLASSRPSGPARPGRSRSRSGPRSAAASPRSARSSPALLLEHFDWGSVFLVTLPLAVLALVIAMCSSRPM